MSTVRHPDCDAIGRHAPSRAVCTDRRFVAANDQLGHIRVACRVGRGPVELMQFLRVHAGSNAR